MVIMTGMIVYCVVVVLYGYCARVEEVYPIVHRIFIDPNQSHNFRPAVLLIWLANMATWYKVVINLVNKKNMLSTFNSKRG